MPIHSNPKLQKSSGYDVSPWLVKTPVEMAHGRKLGEIEMPLGSFEIIKGLTSVWGRLRWGKASGGLALRLVYAVDGLDLEPIDDLRHIRITTAYGRTDLAVWLAEEGVPLLRWRTTLTPSADLLFPFWPRDVVPLTNDDDPLGTQGTVHAMQRGPKMSMVYATLEKPAAGAFLYMQDLTSLNDYCQQTETEPFNVVGGNWPELGFQLPRSLEKPVVKGRAVVISDALLAFSEEMPNDHSSAARVFIDLFGVMYPHLQRPETQYHDWLARADETVRDLDKVPGCTTRRRGLRYLNAYHGSEAFPPESMVQLSVLVPMIDYASRRRLDVPLIGEILGNIPSFYNQSLGTMVRYLPGDDFSAGREPQQKHEVMDSWYLYHTLLNLGRLALSGDAEAKRLMLASMPFAMRVARQFSYHWPVFYDLNTLEPIREKATGDYGETDVAGLYAHCMLHAYELSDDKQYLDEAVRAADTLEEYGFEMAYQLNSTLYGAMALGGLWKRTGKVKYRELSFVCMANFLANCWMWQCEYGHGKSYPTFFGLPPLQDGNYIAIYEESESVAAMASYIRGMGQDCPPALNLLLNEYCKHLLHRSWYAFPTELPRKILAEKTKDGTINPKIAIPLEDIGGGRYAPGQVGQQVYGAGAPLIFSAFVYHEAAEGDFAVFCDYLSKESKASGNRGRGQLRLDVAGSAEMSALLRVIPTKIRRLPRIEVRQGREEIALKRVGRELEGQIRGGEPVIIRWGKWK